VSRPITIITISFDKSQTIYNTGKHQLSLTNPHDALHHRKRAANKGGRSVW